MVLTVILGYQIFLPVGREEETVAYSYLDIIPSTTYQLCSWFKSFNSQGQIIRLSVDDEDSKYFSISINGNKLQIETEKDETEPIISGPFSKCFLIGSPILANYRPRINQPINLKTLLSQRQNRSWH